jgi:hypothetical protein
MLEAEVPYPLLSRIIGRRTATTIRVAKRYGLIGHPPEKRGRESLSRNRLKRALSL